MINLNDDKKIKEYFNEFVELIGNIGYKSIIVTHLIPDKLQFIEALDKICPISFIIPKPKSINHEVRKVISEKYSIEFLTREDITNFTKVRRLIDKYLGNEKFIILDVGGYFATALDQLKEFYSSQIIGIVEDTENGQQKYDKHKILPIPVISVARSILKDPEDFLVGQSIVFSAEVIMREINEIFTGKRALVLGYGKIGHSIAQFLSSRNLVVHVFDQDPTKRLRAFSHGFQIPDREVAIKNADLIFSATGKKSLTHYDFTLFKDGCAIFSATSSDDEFFITDDYGNYKEIKVSAYITKYKSDKNYFYIANKGNAVNFIHGAKVGKFIHLVQGEIIMAINHISNISSKNVAKVPEQYKKDIATMWIKYFNTYK